MTRPLKIHESAPESLKEISDAELDYCAHLILNEFASSLTGAGTLSVNPSITTGLTSVGVFEDTYRNFPEGNANTSSSSDNYTFYQNLSTVSANPTRPLILDGQNRLKESTDDNLYSHIINRCLQQLTSGGLGSYRLQPTSPGGTWTQVATINNTLQTGVASTTYLWRNTSASAPSAVRPLKARLLGNEYNVIEMTDNDIITMVNTLRNRISSSGIGQYRLQETAPASGTWVSVGSVFSDTILGISGSTFSNTYTNTFTATASYSRDFDLTVTKEITTQIEYIGSAVSDTGSIDLTSFRLLPNDIVIVISGSDSGTIPNLATGFTNITTATVEGTTRYMYKFISDPVDTSVTGLTNSSETGHMAMIFRGVDTTDPIDVFGLSTATPVGSSYFGDPNPPSITSTVDGAMIVAMGYLNDDIILTPTPPTNFTLANHNTFGSTGTGGSVMGAYFSQTTAGAIDPSAFNTNGSDWWSAISIALKPLAPYTDTFNASPEYSIDVATYSSDLIVNYASETVFYGGTPTTFQGFYSNTYTGEYTESLSYTQSSYVQQILVDGASYDNTYIFDYPGTVVGNYTQVVSNKILWIRSA